MACYSILKELDLDALAGRLTPLPSIVNCLQIWWQDSSEDSFVGGSMI